MTASEADFNFGSLGQLTFPTISVGASSGNAPAIAAAFDSQGRLVIATGGSSGVLIRLLATATED